MTPHAGQDAGRDWSFGSGAWPHFGQLVNMGAGTLRRIEQTLFCTSSRSFGERLRFDKVVEGFGQINSYSKGYKPDLNLDAFLNLCPEVIDY
jgi:hypothetical protein